MEKAEFIWKNGEFVPWDDANVARAQPRAPLRHRRLRGHPLLRHRGQGPGDLPPPRPPRAPAQVRRALLPRLPFEHSRRSGEATKELIRRNGLRSCYIRPLAFRGVRRDGPVRAERAGRRDRRGLALGRLPGRGGQAEGHPRQGRSWRRISPDSLIPHAKASGQYLNSILAKTETANAGYDEAILLDQRGFVCEGSGENIFVIRDGTDRDAPHISSILDGITRKSVIQIAARPRLPGGRARHRPRRALPGRRDLPHRHRRRAGPGARDRRPRPRRARARSPARSSPSSRTPCTAAPRSTWSGWTRSASRPADAEPTPGQVEAEEVGEPS